VVEISKVGNLTQEVQLPGMANNYKQGNVVKNVKVDSAGVMEPVKLDYGTTFYNNFNDYSVYNGIRASGAQRWYAFTGTLDTVKPQFTTNGQFGPNARYTITGAGSEPGLQLPDKDALDATLRTIGFDPTYPVSFEMTLMFPNIGPPIPLLDSADGLVTWNTLGTPLVANNHEQWILRLVKGSTIWSDSNPWTVQATRTPRLPLGYTYSPKIVGTATAFSSDPQWLQPEYYLQISDASANFVLPTFAQFEAFLGPLGATNGQKLWLTWKVRIHNNDGANTLTFAGATGVTADTNSVVTIPANGTGHLHIRYDNAGTAMLFYVI
jgi:hypothetical protein